MYPELIAPRVDAFSWSFTPSVMTAAIQQRIPAPAARQRHQVVVPARRLDDLDVGRFR